MKRRSGKGKQEWKRKLDDSCSAVIETKDMETDAIGNAVGALKGPPHRRQCADN